MILHIKSKVEFIDAAGIAYLQINSFPFFSFQVDVIRQVTIGEEIELWMYMILKEVESKMDLKFFGFQDHSEIDLFEKLMSISGVGPKMSFHILKNISKTKLIEILVGGEYDKLKKIPGIGDKLAKRIVLELSRIYSKDENLMSKLNVTSLNENQKQVTDTLVQMGFEKNDIINQLNIIDSKIPKKDMLKEVLTLLTSNGRK